MFHAWCVSLTDKGDNGLLRGSLEQMIQCVQHQGEDGQSQHPSRPCKASSGLGPAALPSPLGQGNGVTLEAVRHEGGHRAPEVVVVVPVEDKVLVEGKACTVHAPL